MSDAAAPARLSRWLDDVRRAPGRYLAIVLGLHVLIWTALPALLSENLQLDLAEGVALGREWQLGYWKLPPLPWWICYGAVSLGGATPARSRSAGHLCFSFCWARSPGRSGSMRCDGWARRDRSADRADRRARAR